MLHVNLADHSHRGSSPIHRLDARIKILGALLFILAVTLLPVGAWFSLAVFWLATLFIAHRSGLGLTYALKRSFVALPFALAAITLPLTVPGPVLGQLGPFTFSVPGTLRFFTVVAKSWVAVQMAVLLTVTTPFPDLLWAMRELHIPKPLISIVSFMYRYMFVLADESLRLRRAREARAAVGAGGKSGGSLLWRGKVAGGMVGNLALRAFERSERIYNAMLARGFKGELLTLRAPQLTEVDRFVLVGWVTFLALVTLIGFVFTN